MKVNNLKSKIKQLEIKNIKSIRTAENFKKKQDELLGARRELKNFKA